MATTSSRCPDASWLREWPATAEALVAVQQAVADAADEVEPWQPPTERAWRAGGVFVAFPRGESGPGARGDAAWVAAVVVEGGRLRDSVVRTGEAAAPYGAGLLALREGPLLEPAVRTLNVRPELLIVNATGRDHPRRAGLALHLGAVLDLPTVGVTDRALLATGDEPGPSCGDASRLVVDGAVVAMRVRTRTGIRALVAHAAWRTDVQTARFVLLSLTRSGRTPEPLRIARHLARSARSRDASA